MKLQAAIAGTQSEVEIREENSRLIVSIDGRSYNLEARQIKEGAWLLVWNGRLFNCHVDGRAASGNTIDVSVGTTQYAVALTDPKRLAGSAAATGPDGAAAKLTAPMPGKVVRVLVSAGDHVEGGAGIIVVEAMKMQNEIKTPKAGSVVAINFEVGETVNAGEVLAIIE